MPASSALATGSSNAVGPGMHTAMASAFAVMAAFIASTISLVIEFFEPVNWESQPRSALASWRPYCVGTKNGFVVTWLTNTNFHLGWDGKLPWPAPAVALLEQASRNPGTAAPAVGHAAPRRKARRLGRGQAVPSPA